MDIHNALVNKVWPYMNAIRDYDGNVVEEYPMVRVESIVWKKGEKFLLGSFYGGVKSGETIYLTVEDIIAW